MAKDTPGSNLIKSLLLDDEEAPVYLHAWGGQSTIARALKSIEEQYRGTPQWGAIRAKVIRKAVIHPRAIRMIPTPGTSSPTGPKSAIASRPAAWASVTIRRNA